MLYTMLAGCDAKRAEGVDELLLSGERYLLDLDYEQALVQFLKVIEIDPKNPLGYLGAAEAYQMLGQFDKAIEILRKGLDAVDEADSAEIREMLERLEGSPKPLVPTPIHKPESTSTPALTPTPIEKPTPTPKLPPDTTVTPPPVTPTPPTTITPTPITPTPPTTITPTPITPTPPTTITPTPITPTPPTTITPTPFVPTITPTPILFPPVISGAGHGFSFEKMEGERYNAKLSASGSEPLFWELRPRKGEPIPSFLSINSSTGSLTATADGAVGTYYFAVYVENSVGYDLKDFEFVIKEKKFPPEFEKASYIFWVNLGSGVFRTMIKATGSSPITYSLVSQPSGISIDSSSGLLVIGTETPLGEYNFTIRATNEGGTATQSCVAIVDHVT